LGQKARQQPFYGYKNHVGVDRKHKLIRAYQVTDASVHDSQPFQQLLDPNNTGKQVWADSAYRSKKIDQTLKQKQLENQIHYKGYRKTPLSEAKQRVNKRRSKQRALVEHIFAFQQSALGGKFIRTIGILRAKTKIGLMNLAYNMKRYLYLQKLNELKITG
jgi:IS5 family transposase